MGKSKATIINDVYFRSPAWIKNLFATYYGVSQNKKRYGKTFNEYLASLYAIKNKSKDEVNAIQNKLLKDFLVFAFENTAFYKNRFNNYGFNPYNFKYQDELVVIPILTKEEVRKNSSQISCAHLFKNIHLAKTGGTTGKPLSIPITNECFQKGYAHQEWLFSLYQLTRNSKSAKCAGQKVVHINQLKTPFWVYDKWNSSLYMSSYHLSDNNLPHYINELERFDPKTIEGYPSAIYLLALASLKLKGNVRPSLVRTGSETLHNYQRAIIEEAFQCKAHNIYGSAENCVSAIECKEGFIHSQPFFGLCEIINKTGDQIKKNEVGSIIGTGFSNYAFPLIRYNLEDLATISEEETCVCGQDGVFIHEIIGRTDDYITTPDGRRFATVGQIFRDIKGLVNAQIIQNSIKSVTIKTIIDSDYNQSSNQLIMKKAREKFGEKIEINVIQVDELEKEKNGKTRLVISKLNKA